MLAFEDTQSRYESVGPKCPSRQTKSGRRLNDESTFAAIPNVGEQLCHHVVVKRFFAVFSLSTSRWYRLTVDDEERHKVEIEKVRKWALAAFREQYIRVYIDGNLRSSY